MSNRNTLWAEVFVDELARSGLSAVCAAPGSRHTSLMIAFAQHPSIKVYSHLDERSAAFFALGIAQATDTPVAVICTSGSAGANMYPAVIEAEQSKVPLIVITADRPPELRHSGANQTINQIKLFGDYPLWFVDVALPEAQPDALSIRNLRTTAQRAFAIANGKRKGVVHLNMPFRKPLEPTDVVSDRVSPPAGAEARSSQPFTAIMRANESSRPSDFDQVRFLADIIRDNPRGIIICGPRAHIRDAEILFDLAEKAEYPILADPLSGMRFHRHLNMRVCGAYETYLRRFDSLPDVIIRIGNVPTSKFLNEYIVKSAPKYYVHITPNGEWSDDAHLVTHLVDANPLQLLTAVNNELNQRDSVAWVAQFLQAEEDEWDKVDLDAQKAYLFDGGIVHDTVNLLPDGSVLFCGNSLPIRHLDQFGKPQHRNIQVYGNRGASGIDGNVSTALGIGAAHPQSPLVAIFGDITFYHDMNGLLAVHRCGVPITIILLNNDGGGIFNRLPVKNFEPEFTQYFLTPHGLNFTHVAALYEIDHVLVSNREEFRSVFRERVGRDSTIIEVQTNSQNDEDHRQTLLF